MQFYEWTKRLGQQHWARGGDYVTLCGRPMLGNNYSSHIKDRYKTTCDECKQLLSEEVRHV